MTTTPALARTALQRLLSRTPQTPADHANAAEVLAALAKLDATAPKCTCSGCVALRSSGMLSP